MESETSYWELLERLWTGEDDCQLGARHPPDRGTGQRDAGLPRTQVLGHVWALVVVGAVLTNGRREALRRVARGVSQVGRDGGEGGPNRGVSGVKFDSAQ